MSDFLINVFHRALISLISKRETPHGLYWEKGERWIGWEQIESPWRITHGESLLYLEGIAPFRGRSPRTLILGATPELRDLITPLGGKVVLVDLSLSMLTRMSKLLRVADPDKEIWIRGDWLDTPLPDDYFDVVLADLVFSLVLPEQHLALAEKIRKTLRKGGRFILREHHPDLEIRKKSADEVFEDFFLMHYRKFITRSKASGYLSMKLLDWSMEEGSTKRDKMIQAVRSYRDKYQNRNEPVLLDWFLKRNSVGVDFYFPEREALASIFAHSFLTMSEKTASDNPLAPFYPLYVFEKI